MKPRAKMDCGLECSASNLTWRRNNSKTFTSPNRTGAKVIAATIATDLENPGKDPKNKAVLKFRFPAPGLGSPFLLPSQPQPHHSLPTAATTPHM